MAEISLSIASLFEQAFGYKPTSFEQSLESGLLPLVDEKTTEHPYGRERTTRKGQPFTATDKFGMDYYLPVKIDGHDLEHPVISIVGKKNIISTALTERQGTVKELINTTDWEITIRGLIIDKYGDYPEDEISTMVDLFHRDKAVEIESAVTDIFLMRWQRKGNNTIVIKEMSFPEVKGISNVRPYELKLLSDAPFNLEEIG